LNYIFNMKKGHILEKEFGQLQIELSSRCNLRCRTCLYRAYEDRWVAQDMADDVLGAVLTVVPRAQSVHLQGWGESLLRTDLPQIVAAVKAAGGWPSLSSNGTLMDAESARALISAGLASMTFSLAGPNRRSHDLLRGAGTFSKAVESIRCFAWTRSEPRHPPLLVNYLLTPYSLKHLPEALALCARLGVDTLVATHLVHAVTAAQSRLAVYGRERPYWLSLARSRLAVLWRKVTLILPALRGEPLPICPKDPTRSAFVAADGSVSPCVYLCPPIEATAQDHASQGRRRLLRLVMGNLKTERFDAIWQQPSYRQFRTAFVRRQALFDEIWPPVRTDFEGLERLNEAVSLLKRRFRETPYLPPDPCRDCPHLWGY
jgi:MoaA/NifB/PqqE/SkfB family radical SAM enzyme